jgi:DNA mismatch repair protein MutS2
VPQEEVRQIETKLAEMAEAVEPLRVRSAVPMMNPPKPGQQVWIPGLRSAGEVMDTDSDEAEVQVGAFRVRVPVVDLEPLDSETITVAERPAPRPARPEQDRPASPPLELSCRGLRVEEAMEMVGQYLDQAFRAGLPMVRIIHGKGTGALRRAVREELARHPLVASFRSGAHSEGGEGVTIAELAQGG